MPLGGNLLSLLVALGLSSCGPGLHAVSGSSSSSAPSVAVPLRVSGLELWYSASSFSAASGSTLTSWSDLSGNSRTATAIGTPKIARSTAHTLSGGALPNNQPVVRIAFGDGFQSPAIPALDTGTQTWFAVTDCSGGVSDHAYIAGQYTGGAGGSSNRLAVLKHFTTGTQQAQVIRSDTNVCQATPAGVPCAAGTYRVYTLVLQSDTVFSFYVNGTLAATHGPGATITPVGHVRTYLGQEDGSNSLMDGDIADALVYSRELSTSERRSIECYLQSKYGTAALPFTCG